MEAGLDGAALNRAWDNALSGGGSGCVIRGGKLVLSWGDPAQRYDLKSSTKSFGAAALGLAVELARNTGNSQLAWSTDHGEDMGRMEVHAKLRLPDLPQFRQKL